MKRTSIILMALFYSLSLLTAQKVERGPYTLETISDGIYQIQDYNSERGRGTYTNEQGQVANNNCSDMYLITGKSKALLIDLSNNVRWADNAAESLKSLIGEYARGRDLVITVTHSHGDHLGMLYAFSDDAKVNFWIPKADFPNQGSFLIEPNRDLCKKLDDNKFQYTYYETGEGHIWKNWRIYLTEFTPLLFK